MTETERARIEAIQKELMGPDLDEARLKRAADVLRGRELGRQGKQLLAEVTYLLAREALRTHDVDRARAYAEESISLYDELGVNTLEEAAPLLYVHLPDIMHGDVVRERIMNAI